MLKDGGRMARGNGGLSRRERRRKPDYRSRSLAANARIRRDMAEAALRAIDDGELGVARIFLRKWREHERAAERRLMARYYRSRQPWGAS
jgi:hypothetical protein